MCMMRRDDGRNILIIVEYPRLRDKCAINSYTVLRSAVKEVTTMATQKLRKRFLRLLRERHVVGAKAHRRKCFRVWWRSFVWIPGEIASR